MDFVFHLCILSPIIELLVRATSSANLRSVNFAQFISMPFVSIFQFLDMYKYVKEIG